MVVLKQFTTTQFNGLNNIEGRLLYDNTLKVLKFNDSTTYHNILLFKDHNNNLININNLSLDGNLNISNHNRNTNTGLMLNGVLVTATASELNYTQVTPGTASASKALVLDSDRDIENINILSATTLIADTINLTSALIDDLGTTGNVGINTTARLFGLEVNHSTGNCLRLTYNDDNGSPNYRCDFKVTPTGSLTIEPTGNNPTIMMAANLSSHSLSLTKQNVSNNTVALPLNITTLPDTAAAIGLGSGMEFSALNSTYTIFTLGTFESYATNITDGSETAAYKWRLANNGILTQVASLSSTGIFSCNEMQVTTLQSELVSSIHIAETSDIRLKENINPLLINESVNKILQLEPKTYNFKNKINEECYGFIAQEVKEILPAIVKISKSDMLDDLHQIQYTSLIPHLVNCIKDLYNKLEQIENNN